MTSRIILFTLTVILLGCGNNDKPATEQKNSATQGTPVTTKKTIVFFGNSLTAGYGLTPSEAFPALIQKKIDS